MIVNANALHIPLADQSVHCCITSPPYWGLRDYGTGQWEGGSVDCDHKRDKSIGVLSSTLGGGKSTTNHQQEADYRDVCGKCGAVRVDAQIGLEPTPELYVAHLVQVFREVWRVLRADGVLFLNLGDSYASAWSCNRRSTIGAGSPLLAERSSRLTGDLKEKDLVGIPWMVAFALRADGWYLRSDIIWAKPNPMPESVTDRPTKAHEYVFLLSKSSRYYYDAEAIKEANASPEQLAHNLKYAKTYEAYDERAGETGQPGNVNNVGIHSRPGSNGRNRRSVWTIATSPYSGAHFATFPPKLVEPMILAGCPVGGIVLDPFAGSGTVGRVAIKHNRRAVMLELNPKYLPLQQERTNRVQRVMI